MVITGKFTALNAYIGREESVWRNADLIVQLKRFDEKTGTNLINVGGEEFSNDHKC